MIPMEKKLLDLYARLSRAAARSHLYAMRANMDERPELAKLFLAIADSQAMQAQRFLVQIRGTVGQTDENEQHAFGTELPAAIAEYQELRQEAEQLGSKALATGFRHSAEVSRLNIELHDSLERDNGQTDYYVCDFCGYIATDEPPDNCPICTAEKNRFKMIDFAA